MFIWFIKQRFYLKSKYRQELFLLTRPTSLPSSNHHERRSLTTVPLWSIRKRGGAVRHTICGNFGYLIRHGRGRIHGSTLLYTSTVQVGLIGLVITVATTGTTDTIATSGASSTASTVSAPFTICAAYTMCTSGTARTAVTIRTLLTCCTVVTVPTVVAVCTVITIDTVGTVCQASTIATIPTVGTADTVDIAIRIRCVHGSTLAKWSEKSAQ